MNLTSRQKKISEIVRTDGPITGQNIADKLHLTRAALRSDLAILVMSGVINARPKVGYFYNGKNALGLLTEEVSDILVSDIQSPPVVIQNSKSAYEAIITLFVEDVGSIYVVDEQGPAETDNQQQRGYESGTCGRRHDPVIQIDNGISGHTGIFCCAQSNRQSD